MRRKTSLAAAVFIGVALVASGCASTHHVQHPRVRQLNRDLGAYRDPAWSPDGRWLAYARADVAWTEEKAWTYEIYVMDLQTGETERLTDNQTEDRHPSWSPDGRWLAFQKEIDPVGGPGVWLMGTDGSQTRSFSPCSNCRAPVWSPDREELLVIARSPEDTRNHLRILEVTSGVHREIASGQELYFAVWHPDGDRIAYVEWVGRSSQIVIMDVNGGRGRTITIEGAWIKGLSWSPSGSYLTFAADLRAPADGNDDIFILELDTEDIQPLLEEEFEFDFEGPAWSPNGRYIAFVYGGPSAYRDLYIAEVPEEFR